MANPLRVTAAVSQVLAAFLDSPDTARYGWELMQTSGHSSGRLYPILWSLRTAGWVDARWEESGRRSYRLTPDGQAMAHAEFATRQATTADPPDRVDTRALTLRPIHP
ncbi:MAG TPA: helix-turn-helix transcriptional regulator [Actinoplanes sp.]|nr:helix-turn-helix transcriptional regulator [Actinoplanes sp.]